MKHLWSYIKKYAFIILGGMLIKLMGSALELLIPYVLEHLIDNIVPQERLSLVCLWGGIMLALAVTVRLLNVTANRLSVRTAKRSIYEIRRDLFHTALNLTGNQMDQITLPSLISRMTSDTYNVQSFIQSVQTVGIRAPILLIGGIVVTLSMDRGLALILCIMAPILITLVVFVSMRGIPLYEKVQQCMDQIVRIMRENISGIRVVKALSKEPFEIRRFSEANNETAKRDILASVIMAMPGPLVTLFLNMGLTLVVIFGAQRVNAGVTKPGVILAFLTYFNMIMMGVMGLNRVFMMLSKANTSANRIASVIHMPEDLPQLKPEAGARTDREGFIVFDHVTFSYDSGRQSSSPFTDSENSARFAGSSRQVCLSDIDFTIPKGGSLGIIGATGSGKTTIINLLMRFYDPEKGHVFINGQDVRTMDKDEFHRMFGVVFQNDALFAESIRENIVFGRNVDDAGLTAALEDARAADFVMQYEDGPDHLSAIHGSNFSGGQRQRLLIARALAAKPEILILDDASSALDYRTDASLRQAIREHHGDATLIVIAQRVSSIMNLDEIIVIDEGQMIGRGTHETLLRTCPAYREIHETQMGEVD
ncbi:MAG: ABC transporter ATP-binding protein [Clostridia bacterium]|nr:ABC transporter ATP-binding protein [Clostridia bacterium]